MSRLKDLCRQPAQYGLNITPDSYQEAGVRLLRTSDIREQGQLNQEGVYLAERDVPTEYRLQAGDVLFSRSGTIGRCFLYDPAQHGGCTFAGFLVRFRLAPQVDPRAIAYWSQSAGFQEFIQADAVESTIMNFNAERYANLAIPQRLTEASRQIADYLDAKTARIDKLLELNRQALELAGESFAAKRAHLVLCGLDPVSGQSAVPPGWRTPLLGVLVELHRGLDLPAESREAGSIPVVSSGGVSGWHSVAACQGPGVVTGRYGTVGCVFFVDGPYWPLNTTLYVSDFRGNLPRWVYHMLSTMPLDIDADKSAVTGINRNVVGQLRAVQPPYREQQRIADELDQRHTDVERMGAVLRQRIDLLVERRQALITAAVTGQIEIPGVAA